MSIAASLLTVSMSTPRLCGWRSGRGFSNGSHGAGVDAMPTWREQTNSLLAKTIGLSGGQLVNTEFAAPGFTSTAQSIRRLVRDVGLNLVETLRMATSNPARLMGLDLLFLNGN